MIAFDSFKRKLLLNHTFSSFISSDCCLSNRLPCLEGSSSILTVSLH